MTDPSFLQVAWFLLVGVLWTGYFVLEGFDFGVGTLLPVLGKGKNAEETEKRRRVMLTTIGPHWDGSEVWLLTAGGATFAAFPNWYATMFSAFYLPLLLILVCLIVRNMGFEYRGKRDSATWRARWDIAIIFGSVLPPVLLGVAFTNLVLGVPIDKNMEFTGNFFSVLDHPLKIVGGLALLALCLLHGAHFLSLKTEGPIREDARALAAKLGPVATVLAVILLVWIFITKHTMWSTLTSVLAAVALLASLWFNKQGREGWAFTGTAVTLAMAVATYFFVLFPNVMVSSTPGGTTLTIMNSSSTDMTLKIMTGAAVVFTPIVLLYTGYTYWVFRKRIGTHHIPKAVAVK